MRSLCIALLAGSVLAAGGCSSIEVRVNPERLEAGQTANVVAKVAKPADGEEALQVSFTLASGQECGSLSPASASSDGEGTARTSFAADARVQDCLAVIEASAGNLSGQARVLAGSLPLPVTRIDGVGAIALILIAAFAIDRIVRGLFFLLSFWPWWTKNVPRPRGSVEGDLQDSAARGNTYQLAYFSTASLLGIVALGWYGEVRVLSALGFVRADPLLDTLITGLILVGGADRMEPILSKLAGQGGAGATGGSKPPPIEITGTLKLEENSKSEVSASSSSQGGRGFA